MKEQTKARKFPNALVIVFVIMCICAILTWLIPAGKYDVVEGSSVLDPSTYHAVDQTPVGLWALLSAVFGGMTSASSMICFTFFVGGLFNVVIDTKAVDGFVAYLIRKLGTRSNVILPILALIMSILGATGVMANPVVAVIPIGLILARQLKLDQIVALAVMYLAAYGGYGTSPLCAMTVQMAQKIADLPILSGFGFRSIIWLVFFIPTTLYTMRYVKKIEADPSASLMGADSYANQEVAAVDIPFTIRDALVLIGLIVGLGIYTWGSLAKGWGMAYMATIVFCIALFSAVVSGMGADGLVTSFLDGCRKMSFSAMLIGLASGVSVILNSGNILHTIVYGMGLLLNSMPHVLAAPIMFWFNLLFNFLVNSGSGQANVIMPILAPLADVTGVTRQVAVSAFQLGDGLSNIVFPTSGTLMACLAVAGVDFKKWIKWVMPLFGLWVVMGTVVMIVISAIGIA